MALNMFTSLLYYIGKDGQVKLSKLKLGRYFQTNRAQERKTMGKVFQFQN